MHALGDSVGDGELAVEAALLLAPGAAILLGVCRAGDPPREPATRALDVDADRGLHREAAPRLAAPFGPLTSPVAAYVTVPEKRTEVEATTRLAVEIGVARPAPTARRDEVRAASPVALLVAEDPGGLLDLPFDRVRPIEPPIAGVAGEGRGR